MATLYLIETHAKTLYFCSACNKAIPRGTAYFRHDPHPSARQHRGQKTSHWCRDCIIASDPGLKDQVIGRLRIPAVRILASSSEQSEINEGLFAPVRVQIVSIRQLLTERLLADPTLIHRLTPDDFEEFICERLFVMGMEPKRIGPTNRKDGGIDIVFWPRTNVKFPFLGAAQIKHHRNPDVSEGPSTVRDFAGAIANSRFNAGILVTNTSFSPDAQWFARERAKLIRLRELDDIRRWLIGNFDDDAEWREIPSYIELCPGVTVKIRE